MTVADSDTVNIRQLILILTVTLGVLEPLHLLSRHAHSICTSVCFGLRNYFFWSEQLEQSFNFNILTLNLNTTMALL